MRVVQATRTDTAVESPIDTLAPPPPLPTRRPRVARRRRRHVGWAALATLALVGVIFEDTVSNIRGFLGSELGRYPVAADPGGRIALDYGVDNPPEKYLVAPNGVIFEKIIGPVTTAGLDRQIANAKAEGW